MAWHIEYYKHHDGSVPAAEFMDGCPIKIDAQFNAVLDAVAAAPPPKFSGGGKWEAMHGSMSDYYEIRLTDRDVSSSACSVGSRTRTLPS